MIRNAGQNILTSSPVFNRSRLGESHVFCTLCRADIKITSGAKNDLERYVQTTKHKSYAVSAGTSSKISSFFSSDKKNSDLAVIRAETMFTDFIVQNNLPVAVSDKLSSRHVPTDVSRFRRRQKICMCSKEDHCCHQHIGN
eukprot:TRINITY_DN32285_c0_g1_i9.p1 TRINITY_DN32285_c0_g1~~TRINITY_DN32285_c0_g1_i9.p1  ORF type:complete len:141 (+),score=7.34 TRINITY_DN32285_c0_g1_i9:74-496(+)